MNHLLHPELVHDMPVVGGMVAHMLNTRAEATLADDPMDDPPISVVVRARNEAPHLAALLEDVSRQIVGSEVEIVVVDNESTDGTPDVARRHGATVVNLPKDDFTYPRSMNLGVKAATNDTVFLTVAHAQLPTDATLHAAARHFNPDSDVAGVFGGKVPLLGPKASWSDMLASTMNSYVLVRGPVTVKKAGMGVMAAVGATISKRVWSALGRFDEDRETGGEDTILARDMLAAGRMLIRDPAALVHHSHGLSAIATAKEVWHFAKTLRAPQKMEGGVKTRRQARFAD